MAHKYQGTTCSPTIAVDPNLRKCAHSDSHRPVALYQGTTLVGPYWGSQRGLQPLRSVFAAMRGATFTQRALKAHTSTQRAHKALKAHTSTQRAHRALRAHTSTQRAHRALKAHTSTQRAHRALKAHTSTQRAHRALKAHTSTQRAHKALRAHTSTPQRPSWRGLVYSYRLRVPREKTARDLPLPRGPEGRQPKHQPSPGGLGTNSRRRRAP